MTVKELVACLGFVCSVVLIAFIKIVGWHYTQGEQLIYYWPLWLAAIGIALVSYFIFAME